MIVSLAAEFAAFEDYASAWPSGVVVARYDRTGTFRHTSGPVVGCGELSARDCDFRTVGYIHRIKGIFRSRRIYRIVLAAADYGILTAFDGHTALNTLDLAVVDPHFRTVQTHRVSPVLPIILIRGSGFEVAVGKSDLAAGNVPSHTAYGKLTRDDPGIPDSYVRIVPIGDCSTVVGISVPMVFGIVDQRDAVDQQIASRNMNQRFVFVYIGSGGSYGRRGSRTVVDRTFAGQRETLFGRQKIRAAELDGRPFLDVDGFVLGESKFIGILVRKVDVGSNLDVGYFGIGSAKAPISSSAFSTFAFLTTWNVPFGAGVSAILTAL